MAKATRSEGERIRAMEAIRRARALLDAVEIAVRDRTCPPGFEAAQAIADTAVRLAMTIGRIDAYMRAEESEL